MLIVLAEARVEGSALDEARDALETMITASRAEEGCVDYTYAIDILDPHRLMIVEKWVDADALAFHFATPHMAAFQKALGELDVKVVELKKYQADDGAPLM